MKCLIKFNYSNNEFWIPELNSIAKLYNFSVKILENPVNLQTPFVWVDLEKEEHATLLCERSVLIKGIYEIWTHETTVKDTIEKLSSLDRSVFGDCVKEDTSYKLVIDIFGRKLKSSHRIETIDKLACIPFEGKVDLTSPAHAIWYIEDYGSDVKCIPEFPHNVYVGREMGTGTGRRLIDDYKLTKREYIGTTSMSAELSLLSATQGLARPNTTMYDPFVGTGSLMIACAHFGSYVCGSDIDPRPLRGKGHGTVIDSFKQYGTEGKFLDTFVGDISHTAIAERPIFDTIVCDPPYGIREDARTLGAKKNKRNKNDDVNLKKRKVDTQSSTDSKSDEIVVSKVQDLDITKSDNQQETKSVKEHDFKSTKIYPLAGIFFDLLDFSAQRLVLGGRLVFWLPVFSPRYADHLVPSHPSLTLISNSEDQLTLRWSRRLITMEKTSEYVRDGDSLSTEQVEYFNGFRSNIFNNVDAPIRHKHIKKKKAQEEWRKKKEAERAEASTKSSNE